MDSSIILPMRQYIAADPAIVDVFGVPEIFANGAVFRDCGEMVEIDLYAKRAVEGGGFTAYLCGVIRMLKTEFIVAVAMAKARLTAWMGPPA